MTGVPDPQDWTTNQVREWLLLLLRFAITQDPKDADAATSAANVIDSLGLERGASAPTFFRRTNDDVCRAIVALDDPKREAVLKEHLKRIDDVRLKAAFRAVLDIEKRSSPGVSSNKRRDLWTSLRR